MYRHISTLLQTDIKTETGAIRFTKIRTSHKIYTATQRKTDRPSLEKTVIGKDATEKQV